jgi:hypothetical protein
MTTPSEDLPGTIDNLFDFAFDAPAPGPAAAAPRGGLNPQAVQGFAEGGMVDPLAGGAPAIDTGLGPEGGAGLAVPGGQAAAPTPAGNEDLEGQAKRLLREQPAMAAQMLKSAEDALEMGEMTEEMLMQGGKMAIVVARNPDMYPKMLERLTAMGASDLPPEYDPEFIFTAIILYLAWQDKDKIKAGGAEPAAEGGAPAQDQIQDFAKGGYVRPMDHAAEGGAVIGPGTGTSDSIPINVSRGEYVIPAHIVKSKGKEFFDNMISKYDPDRQA